MNSLTWFLYLIHVIDGLRHVAAATVIFGGAALGGIGLMRIAEPSVTYLQLWFKTVWISMTVGVVVLVLVPSPSTLYMMAASELGEMVAQQQITQDLAKEVYSMLRSGLNSLAN